MNIFINPNIIISPNNFLGNKTEREDKQISFENNKHLFFILNMDKFKFFLFDFLI